MEKLKKYIPDKISIVGHKVVVSDKTFNEIVQTLDKQTTAINKIIDIVEDLCSRTGRTEQNINKLAKAMKTILED